MTLRLLAVVIAVLLLFWVEPLRHWRNYSWFTRWADQCSGMHGGVRLAVVLAPPVVVTAIIGILLGVPAWLGIVWLAFAVLVMIHTLGPRDLDTDIDAIVAADDLATRQQAAQALRAHADDDTAVGLQAPALVEAAVWAGLKRRFGVVFWFLVLGPGGAVLYRLAQILGDRSDTDDDSRHVARRCAEMLDWPAAHLMVFAMALVSKFEAVMRAWREWHREPTHSAWAFECGFLGPVARASVNADVAAGDEDSVDISDPLVELTDTRHLLRRMLVVWLAVVALLVIATWIA